MPLPSIFTPLVYFLVSNVLFLHFPDPWKTYKAIHHFPGVFVPSTTSFFTYSWWQVTLNEVLFSGRLFPHRCLPGPLQAVTVWWRYLVFTCISQSIQIQTQVFGTPISWPSGTLKEDALVSLELITVLSDKELWSAMWNVHYLISLSHMNMSSGTREMTMLEICEVHLG